MNVIVENALELAQDAFGNYVLQQIMDTAQVLNRFHLSFYQLCRIEEDTLRHLIQRLKGSMSKLAVQKFSSIVVEKCVGKGQKVRFGLHIFLRNDVHTNRYSFYLVFILNFFQKVCLLN